MNNVNFLDFLKFHKFFLNEENQLTSLRPDLQELSQTIMWYPTKEKIHIFISYYIEELVTAALLEEDSLKKRTCLKITIDPKTGSFYRQTPAIQFIQELIARGEVTTGDQIRSSLFH